MVSRAGRGKPVEAGSRVDSRTHAAPSLPAWVRQSGPTTLINVHARPGAKKAAVVGVHGDRLKVAIDAPPVDGKANEALLRYFAEVLDLSRGGVTLQGGAGHRDKCVAIADSDAAEVARRLAALIPAGK